MAGLPAEVIERAREILIHLEGGSEGGGISVDATVASAPDAALPARVAPDAALVPLAGPPPQVSLFELAQTVDPAVEEVTDRLRRLAIDRTGLDAT